MEGRTLGAPSFAERWAESSSAALGGAPQTPVEASRVKSGGASVSFTRVFSSTLLGGALVIGAGIWASHTITPWLDRSLRAETYEPAAAAIEQARAAGFEGGDHTLGSTSLFRIAENLRHLRQPEAHPDLGMGSEASNASFYIPIAGSDVNLLPVACNVHLASNKREALLAEAKADLRFTALHELSHCDAMTENWARLSPSPELLSAEQARALRLVILADSRLDSDAPDVLATARVESSVSEGGQWRQLGIGLFRETIADARTALILSRVEPGSWRSRIAELWLNRAGGDYGAVMLAAHNHATEEALGIILSVPDARLATLSPKELNELSAQAASDALVIKLAKQGWHERYAPHLASSALIASLADIQSVPASSPRWEKGELRALGVSPEQLRSDLAWAQSPAGAQALGSLFARMGELHDQGQRHQVVARPVGAQTVAYALAPSAGGLDLRYEGAMARSSEVGDLASAVLLERARKMGGEGFKTPDHPRWRQVQALASGAYSSVVAQLTDPNYMVRQAGKPVYLGLNPKTDLFVTAPSPEILAQREGRAPELPRLNLDNRRSLKISAPKPAADSSPKAP